MMTEEQLKAAEHTADHETFIRGEEGGDYLSSAWGSDMTDHVHALAMEVRRLQAEHIQLLEEKVDYLTRLQNLRKAIGVVISEGMTS